MFFKTNQLIYPAICVLIAGFLILIKTFVSKDELDKARMFMKKYIFEGYSDDSFYETGITNYSLDNCASGKPMTLILKNKNEVGIIVSAFYDSKAQGVKIGINGCWAISVQALNEECLEQLSFWNIKIEPCHKYYNRCVIECPDDVLLFDNSMNCIED